MLTIQNQEIHVGYSLKSLLAHFFYSALMTTELKQISCSEAEKASNEGVEGSQIVFLKDISNLFVWILLDSLEVTLHLTVGGRTIIDWKKKKNWTLILYNFSNQSFHLCPHVLKLDFQLNLIDVKEGISTTSKPIPQEGELGALLTPWELHLPSLNKPGSPSGG